MINLSDPAARKRLAKQILTDIDTYCVQAYNDGLRTHLGASIIGHDCARYLQYTFRWFDYVPGSGRMSRLWNRGHVAEHRFTEWLRGIGFHVWQFQDDGVTQFRCSGIDGHYGGSLDGINRPPARYSVGEPLLCEFKTNGTGRGFTELMEKGVRLTKHKHFVQMSTYGKFYGLRYALYMCINKNDDDLHVEIVELDYRLADERYKLAEDVIRAKALLPKISSSSAYFECKMCDMANVCWQGKPAMRNCRSCKHSAAIEDKQWACAVYGSPIPENVIPNGCPQWEQFGA